MVSTFVGTSLLENIFQLIVVLIIFIFVLIATYFTTRFIGKSGMVQTHSKNIKVFETFKIAPNKYIQIIKLGSKYYAISVSKENVQFLAELSEEQLVLDETPEEQITFKEIIEKISSKVKNKKNV